MLGSVGMIEPASAANITAATDAGLTLGKGVCSTSHFTPSATDCAGAFDGLINQPTERGKFLTALNNGLFAESSNWFFSSKQDSDGIEGTNSLGASVSGFDSKSGSVSFASLDPAKFSLVLVPKGATEYAAYYFQAGKYTATSFGFTTDGIKTPNGNNNPELSNFSVFARPVPTPALLPGLIGMGVAALRKRKAEAEDNTAA